MVTEIKEIISSGNAVLGIEFGSTRVKAVLIDCQGNVLASGGYGWENRLENGIWTYSREDMLAGLRESYSDLADEVFKKYSVKIKKLKAIGISGMMHGYLPFDKDGNIISPFRTWRNTVTEEASDFLSKKFDFHVPQRWSISHLCDAIMKKESHVEKISYMTTLAGYIHFLLSGEKVLGICDASGMFPIDRETCNYDKNMMDIFDDYIKENGYSIRLNDILPKVLCAGENAGFLTKEGAALMDASGELEWGIPMCAPEGDAGTGMVATDSVRENTGNISAGTSIFAMAVLPHKLKKAHDEIDVVSTPAGKPVAMVHCNNCTGEIDNWVKLYKDFLKSYGVEVSVPKIYDTLYNAGIKDGVDCSDAVIYNYISGEHITGINSGAPLMLRAPGSPLDFSKISKSLLFSTLATIRIGMDILYNDEEIKLEKISGHGGFYKTPVVGQKVTAAALKTPVTVMKTAGEGGSWGIAILALYMIDKKEGETLEDYIDSRIFSKAEKSEMAVDEKLSLDFDRYIENYKKCLIVEKSADGILM